MYSLNKAQIIGNLTRDPEVRQTPNGQMVATIGIATNRVWKDQTGNRQEATEFHNLVAWGKLAEICGQYLRKGMKAYFEGRLQTRSWDDESGKKNYKTEIIVEEMIILTNKSQMEGMAGMASSASAPRAVRSDAMMAPEEGNAVDTGEKIRVEDLPF